MSRSTISQTASRDLAKIIDYFSNLNIEAGERFIKEFEKKCKNLVDFPNMERRSPTVVAEKVIRVTYQTFPDNEPTKPPSLLAAAKLLRAAVQLFGVVFAPFVLLLLVRI